MIILAACLCTTDKLETFGTFCQSISQKSDMTYYPFLVKEIM